VIHENASLGENGACLLGPIEVGDYVHIGANAVVVKDVEPWANVGARRR
jgi:serine acetyltransferase